MSGGNPCGRYYRTAPPILSLNQSFNYRFAPTGFTQIVSHPKVKLAYVPYYCVVPTTVSQFKAKFEKIGDPSNWEEIKSSREVRHSLSPLHL